MSYSEQSLQLITNWFATQGWQPFPFQHESWQTYAKGSSGLIHASTGTGKTYGAWLGPVMEWLDEQTSAKKITRPEGLRVLWITPLRALASDTTAALQKPIDDLKIPWKVEQRTGDTSSSQKARQRKRMPTALVTTPESLSLMLSWSNSAELLTGIRAVIVDEWHELLGSKRGVQTELALARLRKWNPTMRTWGLSATLGNIEVALSTLIGQHECPRRLIRGAVDKEITIDSLLPEMVERFPWAGHLGLKLLPAVLQAIEDEKTTLIFTNTRSQTEQWYQALLQAKPDLAGVMAIHHGSLDRKVRDWVENGLRFGTLRCVVCTSSLDLGVDFSPVDRVFQVGSPKGVARLLQRAGRSGHSPGKPSRITFVPTNAFELVEIAACRDAAENGQIEGRQPNFNPLDLLSQHVVTIALGDGFRSEELLQEIRTTHAYAQLSEQEWQWVLNFVVQGGESLRAYPEFRKVEIVDGRYCVLEKRIATRHRQSIGTIVSDPMMQVRFLTGGKLGVVEEAFIAKMRKGDRFVFGGRVLELVRVKDMTAYVRRASSTKGTIPRWMGGRMPLSSELSTAVRKKLQAAKHGIYHGPEMACVRPILQLQENWSALPGSDELLIEEIRSREGYHLFLYPFEGRLVHEGLAALLSFRLAKQQPLTFSLAVNDYGIELLAPTPIPFEQCLQDGLFDVEQLLNDIESALNAAELGKRHFREIARISGLIQTGYPGENRSMRQFQASASLFYDVFRTYDSANLLLHQAHREVLEKQLEYSRLKSALDRLHACRLLHKKPHKPTPFAFPLMVERLREKLSSETLAQRIERMQNSLERSAEQMEIA